MSHIDDGGSAFPHDYQPLGLQACPACPGMTLRDYFAAQVLPYIWDKYLIPDETALAAELAARHAYEVADAMLIARAAKEEG